ncbi:MAG: hypothetical protein IMW93_10080 [Thermoanaerobacteraceae bacterium]|nr:hypothetical protein [Thermoanaerobacteraceae bacterium]
MTSVTLAQSYLVKATKRLKILPVLLQEEALQVLFFALPVLLRVGLPAGGVLKDPVVHGAGTA